MLLVQGRKVAAQARTLSPGKELPTFALRPHVSGTGIILPAYAGAATKSGFSHKISVAQLSEAESSM